MRSKVFVCLTLLTWWLQGASLCPLWKLGTATKSFRKTLRRSTCSSKGYIQYASCNYLSRFATNATLLSLVCLQVGWVILQKWWIAPLVITTIAIQDMPSGILTSWNQCWIPLYLLEVGRKPPCSAKLLTIGKLQWHRSLIGRNHSNRSTGTLLWAVEVLQLCFDVVWGCTISSYPVEVQLPSDLV